MEKMSRGVMAVGFFISTSCGVVAGAQRPGAATPSREQIHPEFVDSTWAKRTAAAWQLAFSSHWEGARANFMALHREQPAAVEPLLGLGFVARATSQRAAARDWYRLALDIEPSADTRKQLEIVEWDRPAVVAISVGATRFGGTTSSDWSGSIVLPLSAKLSLNARAGAIGSGDPFRGIFLDSTRGGGARARLVSGGVVLHPVDGVWLSGRADRWRADGRNEDFLWLDAARRINDWLVARVGVRPLSGATGAPQVNAAADIIFTGQHVVTIAAQQGIRDAPFEARTEARVFYLLTPNVRQTFRVGVVRETGTRVTATTGILAGSWYPRSTAGIRLEMLARHGVYGRTYANVGLMLRR